MKSSSVIFQWNFQEKTLGDNNKKTIFVQYSSAYNNVQPKKVQNNFQPRITYVRNTFYTSKRNELLNKSSCFYCNCKGYTPNTCYMRRFGVPSGGMFRLRKELTKKDQKNIRYLERNINLFFAGVLENHIFIIVI